MRAADPGVTATRVLLGATSSESAVTRGAAAYFRFANARGGVRGRRIEYRVVDDGGDPATAVDATRALVDRDRVLAVVGAVGTEQALATRDFLNAAGVPQLFAASGATALGRDAARYPWTLGFEPSDRAEGWIYGRYLARARPGAHVAVLWDGGDEGRERLAGLRLGVARSSVRVVSAHTSDVEALQRSGATVLALFVPGDVAVEAAAEAGRLGWRPFLVTSAGAPLAGAVSLAFLKDPSDPSWANDPGLRLYRTIMARYAKGADVRDVGHVQGMAIAYATVEALRRSGAGLTRAGLLARARAMRSVSNPFLLPGIAVTTGPGDGFPVEQARLQRWERGRWHPFGGLWRARVP